MLNQLRPKSFLIAVAGLELLVGTFLSLKPELTQKVALSGEDINILAVLFLVGGINTILILELRNSLKRLVFIPVFFAILPWLFFISKSFPGGFYTAILSSAIFPVAIILSANTPSKDPVTVSKSLFMLVTSLISIVIGLTLLSPSQANHPFLVSIKPYILPIAIIFIISGSLTLKLSEKDISIRSFLAAVLSLPMFLLGIYLVAQKTVVSGFTFTILPIMVFDRFLLRFHIKNQEEERPDRERQLLNSYNRVLEYASLGSLLIFIISEKGSKDLTSSILILSFAAASVVWFHVLPHNLLSKKQLFLWLNLYSIFIVLISLTSPQNNYFLILYTIPIFIFSDLFGKKDITYPTLIGLLGVTLSFFLSLIKPDGSDITDLLALTSNRYLTILCISYIARKIST